MLLTNKANAELRVVEPVAALFGNFGDERRLAAARPPVQDQGNARIIIQVPAKKVAQLKWHVHHLIHYIIFRVVHGI